jgi:hypothetical protein
MPGTQGAVVASSEISGTITHISHISATACRVFFNLNGFIAPLMPFPAVFLH